jgi:heme oxygenase
MLSEKIREASKPAHKAAEGSRFLQDLMAGVLPVEAYKDYITQLSKIYEQMESWKPEGWNIFDQKLNRFDSILSDIESLDGSSLVLNASTEYCEYLKGLVKEKDALRMLAHHYTRYMGDLSGGQAIAKIVSRTMSIPDTSLSFYRFEEIDDLVRYKEQYRDQLNGLALSEEEESIFIEEVSRAFELNSKILNDLEKEWIL